MEKHDLEITINPNGEVKVHIKGAKGKACLDYAKWLAEVVGELKAQKHTSEFYEPETKVRIHLEQKTQCKD